VKKIIYALIPALFFQFANAQEVPKLTLKWAPTGLILGNVSLQGEYGFNSNSSLTAKIGIPISRTYHATYAGNDAVMHMHALSFLAGFRKYWSKHPLQGFYLEPFFTYAHHSTDGIGSGTLDNQPATMEFSNDYNGIGAGIQAGAQFIIHKKFVIDLFFFGPQITSSRNNFKAVDAANSISWNSVQADQAEQQIRTFLDQFPFIKNKVDVRVDKQNRTVTANFVGALVGVRFGVSFGIAL
jgi:hypothetical protein